MNENIDYYTAIKSIYENSSVPIVVTDTDLHVTWANKSAEASYPRFRLPDGLISMISSFSMKYVFMIAQQNKIIDKAESIDIPIPLSLEMFTLTPLIDGSNSLAGYVVDFRPTNSTGDALRPEGNQRLIASFSHQYRAPLSQIFSSVSALSRSIDYDEYPTLQPLVNDINQNAYLMFKTSINMTDYMKCVHPNNQLDLSKIKISKFAQELCNAIKIIADRSKAIFIIDIQESDLSMDCDTKKLSAIVLHLVNNSLMFGFEDNTITISMKIVSNNVIFSVSDKGYGIPDKILPHVFDAFYSYDHMGHPFAGSGLGLTLAKAMVNLHGGTIAIESKLDQGTNVSFTIPIHDNEGVNVQSPKKTSEYLLDSFSIPYVLLSDTCNCPNP